MKRGKKSFNPIARWGDKIKWDKRIKAVCKPCWEIKYCPYGPLVEQFPIQKEPDEQSCRIFGHQCPVFYAAEPLTETKELRNVSRNIPRTTQFRVLKRENQICTCCSKSVKDSDIEFDHIIPWSKGGSSDENNIQLLCFSCNRKKRSKFEDKYLIESLSDHLMEPVPIEFIAPLAMFVQLYHNIFNTRKEFLSPLDVCKSFGRRKIRYEDKEAIKLLKDIVEFFNSPKAKEIKKNIFQAMRYRWGFIDDKFHTAKDTIAKFNIADTELLKGEISLISRLGFKIKLSERTKKNWLMLDRKIVLLVEDEESR